VLLQAKGQLHGGAQGVLPRHKNTDCKRCVKDSWPRKISPGWRSSKIRVGVGWGSQSGWLVLGVRLSQIRIQVRDRVKRGIRSG
jgi:hypothetical protein